ncbi:MAG: DUF4249 domain-containing protein [Bacteroidota bacterium]
MSNLKYILPLCFLAAFTFSCEDVIDIDANFTEAQLVVDAFLNDLDTTQTINVSLSQDYFDASLPPAVTDAQVVLTNVTKGDAFTFEHKGDGAYEWTPASDGAIGAEMDEYILTVQYNGFTYEAGSQLNPVPSIDSITHEFREEELGNPEGIYAQFFARDLEGIGNFYWIKAFKNGEFLNKPSELNLSADGTFDTGTGADGIVFLPPIRELINRVPDPDTEDDDEVPPYAEGDHIRVEIHSLSSSTFRFLQVAFEQMTNGDNGIFALPVANSPTNIISTDPNAPEALGFFNISQISSAEIVVE